MSNGLYLICQPLDAERVIAPFGLTAGPGFAKAARKDITCICAQFLRRGRPFWPGSRLAFLGGAFGGLGGGFLSRNPCRFLLPSLELPAFRPGLASLLAPFGSSRRIGLGILRCLLVLGGTPCLGRRNLGNPRLA